MTPAEADREKLPKDAIKDSLGRQLCHDHVHGRCQEPCPNNRFHGKATEAMTKKRIIDEKKIADRKAAAQAKAEAGKGA